jgi:hypothetical protein
LSSFSLHKPISVSRIRIHGAVAWPVHRSLRTAVSHATSRLIRPGCSLVTRR